MKRTERAELSKKKIFNTAIELMKQTDFSDITIRGICREAGVSTGLFYDHFESKHDILIEYYRITDEWIEESIDINLTTDSTENILNVFRLQYRYFNLKDINSVRSLFNALMFTNIKYIHSKSRSVFIVINNIIISGQNNHKITLAYESEVIVNKILVFYRGIMYDWIIKGGEYEFESSAERELTEYLKLFSV